MMQLFARIIYRRHRLTHDNGPVPFFIIGSGRSGTTLVRAILNAHPKLCIPPEIYSLSEIIGSYYHYRFMPWHELARFVISAFESDPFFQVWNLNTLSLYEQAINLAVEQQNMARLIDIVYDTYRKEYDPDAVRWGCKDPLSTTNVHRINWIYPQAQYLHIIRDGRDVVASYLNWGIYDDPEPAARLWLRSVEAAEKFGRRIGPTRYLCVYYEHLISEPGSVLKRICDFLNIQMHDDMLKHHLKPFVGNPHPSHDLAKQPIIQTRVGRYKELLSPQQIEQTEILIGNMLREVGYETGGSQRT